MSPTWFDGTSREIFPIQKPPRASSRPRTLNDCKGLSLVKAYVKHQLFSSAWAARGRATHKEAASILPSVPRWENNPKECVQVAGWVVAVYAASCHLK